MVVIRIRYTNRMLYAAIAIVVVLVVALNAYAFLGKGSDKSDVGNTPENFNELKGAENPEDKCTAPEGYTEEQWRQHMGHHPEQYEECLG